MRTVVWHLPPEYGHFAPTRHLARQLREVGYRSVYVAERDLQAPIEQAGFEYVPYLPDAYPRGSVEARDRLSLEATWDWWAARDLALWREASSGRLEALLASLGPDVIIGDHINPDTSLVAHKLQIPFIRHSSMLPSYYEPDMPPMWSDALPGERSRWELEVEWMCHHALMWRLPWIHRDSPIQQRDFYQFVEACGVHVAQINYRGAFNYHVESDPEIVMCSRAFDFPKPEVPDRVYAGPCLDDDASEPWTYPTRRPGAPLVYCAFGSKALSYPTARVVIARLLEVARARPALDLVIAAPDELFAGHEIPPTVHATPWAPQRRVLQAADVFVTHAGLGSVREAIWEGVPMLAVPQAYDQRGDAARVVYHGLGERLIAEIPPAAALAELLERLRTEPRYRQAIGRMRAQFHAEAAERAGARFVVDVAEGRVRPAAAAYYAQVVDRISRGIMPTSPG